MVARALELGCTSPSLTNDPGTDCFSVGPTSFSGVQWDYYWSSSAAAATPSDAWFITMNVGSTFSALKGGNALFVWPVRDGG